VTANLPFVAPLKHRRYHRRTMTIAVGFCVNDGILLAADRQITQGDLKTNAGKIDVWFDQDPNKDGETRGTLVITGAGDVHYLSAASLLLRDAFIRATPLTMLELRREFETALRHFYEEQIIPFAKWRPEDAPDIALIIAAKRGDQYQMWVTERSSVLPTSKPSAVGAGAAMADSLFQSGYFPIKSCNPVQAQLIAAYVIFQAKQVMESCGQDTDMVFLPSSWPHLDRSMVREVEELFRRYQHLTGKGFHSLFGTRDGLNGTNLNEELREDIEYLLREYDLAGFIPSQLVAQRRSRRVLLSPPPSRG